MCNSGVYLLVAVDTNLLVVQLVVCLSATERSLCYPPTLKGDGKFLYPGNTFSHASSLIRGPVLLSKWGGGGNKENELYDQQIGLHCY